MKNIIFFIIITTVVYSKTFWSDPIQISEDAQWPEAMIGYPEIIVDNNGHIHAFWSKSFQIEPGSLNWYSQIEYSKSNDGGNTWSEIENLTSDYNSKRICEIKAVCDSNNNIHLTYGRAYNPPIDDIYYMVYNGKEWTIPEIIVNSMYDMYLKMEISNSDIVYLVWNSGYYGALKYIDLKNDNPNWSDIFFLSEDDYYIKNISIDQNDDLYAIGTSNFYDQANHTYINRPYLFKFDIDSIAWTKIEEIGSYKEEVRGRAIVVNGNDLYINISVGPTMGDNIIEHLESDNTNIEWSAPYNYGSNNNWDCEMYKDNNDFLHLFEKHYYEVNNPEGITGLIHSIGKNGIWETTVIDSSEDYSYSNPRVTYDIKNDMNYLVYGKFDRINDIGKIYFHSKLNDTSIEEYSAIPNETVLFQNYPNPFNNETVIPYKLKENSEVEINIYNLKGELVKIVKQGFQYKGTYKYKLKVNEMSTGIYYYSLKIGNTTTGIRKMLYLK
ncbi:MAG: T9SS type A sorting domain-containing protein [Candidatus Delongbacteria bacterium]|nr:T9SS type A sorting domain-containing protein [Candidatus Delongbacteria bacterium]